MSRVRPLFQIDRRTRLGRRIAELERLYTDAIGHELAPVEREKVRSATQLTAVAELVRAAYAQGCGTADDVVRCANQAARAVKALGIRPQPSRPSLDEYLKQKVQGR